MRAPSRWLSRIWRRPFPYCIIHFFQLAPGLTCSLRVPSRKTVVAISSRSSCLFLKCQYRAGAWTPRSDARRRRVRPSRPTSSRILRAAEIRIDRSRFMGLTSFSLTMLNHLNGVKEDFPVKAAVVHSFSAPPRYEDFADPTPLDGEVMITVKAAGF